MNQTPPKSIALIATAIVFLVLGACAGAVWMKKLGDNQAEEDKQAQRAADEARNEANKKSNLRPPVAGAPGGLSPPGGGGGFPGLGGPGGGMGGGMGGPSPKAQLTGLITKLDLLTSKPLSISLNEEQRTNLNTQLNGLADKAELSDDDAKKRLDAILEIVKNDKATLEAAGYRWPGAGGGAGGRPGGGGPAPKNPFHQEATAKHLKSFQELLKPKTQ